MIAIVAVFALLNLGVGLLCVRVARSPDVSYFAMGVLAEAIAVFTLVVGLMAWSRYQ